jgi:vanillate O-demethylase monooxygenase subunit
MTTPSASTFVERAWHPVARSVDLAGEPVGAELLGRPFVVFRGVDGAPAVLAGRCPHRGTLLAGGRVVDGAVACPYHGWQFGPTGACQRIPSLGRTGAIPAAAATVAFPAVERDGLVWTSLDPDADPDAIPWYPSPGRSEVGDLRVIVGRPMVWRTSAGRHLENILDLGHFPYVHPTTFGCPEAEVVAPHEVAAEPGRIRCDVEVTTLNPPVGEGRLYPELGPLLRLGYHYEVDLPYRIRLDFAFPDGMQRALHEVVAPTAPDRCTIYWSLLVDRRLTSPDEEELAFAHRVFAEDQPVIESQPPGVPLDRRAEIHLPADRLAVAWRRAMREAGMPEEALV